MTDTQPVVLVETKNGPVRINKSDYDANPSKYKLAGDDNSSDDAAAKKALKEARKSIASKYTLQKEGSGKDTIWFIGDAQGAEVNTDSYENKALAQEALDALIDAEVDALEV